METRGRSAYVTLNVAWFIAVLFVVFLAGMAFQSFADSRTDTVCAICEKALPFSCHSGVYEKCLQARIVQYAYQLDPMNEIPPETP